MSATVTRFYPKNAAQNPDAVIEQAIGQYDSVVIIGYDKNKKLDARASLNLDHKEIHWLLSVFQQKLLNGDYLEEPQ